MTTAGTVGGFTIWDGIYASFADAAPAVEGPGFAGDTWRTRTAAQARECLAALESGQAIPLALSQRSLLLPPVVATMLASHAPLRVLDFGGGLGIGYMTLLQCVPGAAESVEYSIVEVPHICDEGRRLTPRVTYLEALPVAGTRVDLVHASSSLQYVDDWRSALAALAALHPDVMLLSDVFAGAIPTFVTLQNYYGSRIRHWFWNWDEVVEACGRAGYDVVMKCPAPARRLGSDDGLPMDNFPPSHRLEQSLHLLLRRRA